MKQSLRKLQKECDEWNSSNPIGCEVWLKKDGVDQPVKTTTRSEAQILSGHSAVIWLTGISGCYLLKCVKRFKAESTGTNDVD